MSQSRIINLLDLPRSERERGFSLVELIVALVIVSIVIAGASVALASSSSSEARMKKTSDHYAMARKAFERVRIDFTARTACNTGSAAGMTSGWVNTAKNTITSPSPAVSTSAAAFAPCVVKYDDMRDGLRRLYHVVITITPMDVGTDGFGTNDVDGNLRDRYAMAAVVSLDAASEISGETTKSIRVTGTLDWNNVGGGESPDYAYVKISACAVDQPDRAVVAGVCQPSDPSRLRVEPDISLYKVNPATGIQDPSPTGTVKANGAAVAVEPGTYRLKAPLVYGTATLDKIDPATLHVAGTQSYNVLATYINPATDVQVCTQIIDRRHPLYNQGDRASIHDWEIKQTNMFFRRDNAAGYRHAFLYLNRDQSWNCDGSTANPDPKTHHLHDPLSKVPIGLFKGKYDFEVQQRYLTPTIPDEVPANPAWPGLKLTLANVKTNCDTSIAWSTPMTGGATEQRGAYDPVLDANYTPSDDPEPAYYGSADLGGTVTRLCMRFEVRPMEYQPCSASENAASPLTCVFDKCTVDMPSGVLDPGPCGGADYTATCFITVPGCGRLAAPPGRPADDAVVGCTPAPYPASSPPLIIVTPIPTAGCTSGISYTTCTQEAGLYDPDGVPCNGNEEIWWCELTAPEPGYATVVPVAGPTATCPPPVTSGSGSGTLPPAVPVAQYDSGLNRGLGNLNFFRTLGSGAWNMAPPNDGQQNAHTETAFIQSTGRNLGNQIDFVLPWTIGGGVDQNTAFGGKCNAAPAHGGAGDYSMSGSKAWSQNWPTDTLWVTAQLDNDRVDYVNGAIAAPNRLLEQAPAHLCDEITFSAGWEIVNLFGMWSCLEVYMENRPDMHIRGRMIDFAPGWNGSPVFQMHNGAGKALIPPGWSPRMDANQANHYPGAGDLDFWDYVASSSPSWPAFNGDNLAGPGYSDVGGFRAIVREVDNDPVCQESGTTGTPYVLKSRPASTPVITTTTLPSLITFHVAAQYLYTKIEDILAYQPPAEAGDDPKLGITDIGL